MTSEIIRRGMGKIYIYIHREREMYDMLNVAVTGGHSDSNTSENAPCWSLGDVSLSSHFWQFLMSMAGDRLDPHGVGVDGRNEER